MLQNKAVTDPDTVISIKSKMGTSEKFLQMEEYLFFWNLSYDC